MGFGYLFIGYLIAFVLYLTVQALGVGGLALLIGFGTMMLGLWELTHYQKEFVFAKWLCVPLLFTSAYQLVYQLGALFLWNSPIVSEAVQSAVLWFHFFLLVAFHFFLLHAIYLVCREVGIRHMATVAIRNTVFYAIYAVIYVLANSVFAQDSAARSYVLFSLVMMQVVCTVFNLILLINCAKNICAEGEEDVPQKPHRWNFLNKLDSVYDRTRQRAVENARRDGEAMAERRRQRKEKKKNKKR